MRHNGKEWKSPHLFPFELADKYNELGLYPRAFLWYNTAARSNDGYSQNRIGEMYQYGRGVKQNYTDVMFWYKKAHNNGIHPATNNIEMLYSEGLGVYQDYLMGLRWYFVAADEGYDVSQYNVAIYYENGLGVDVNRGYALEWYERAALQGHFGSKYAVKRLNNEGIYLSKQQKRNEQLMKEQKEKGALKEQLKLAEQQLMDAGTEKKHLDLKIKTLLEEIKILSQENHEDKGTNQTQTWSNTTICTYKIKDTNLGKARQLNYCQSRRK